MTDKGPIVERRYKTIVVDPPWEVLGGPRWAPNGKSQPLDYHTMSLNEIIGLPVRELADEGCHLYLWTINKYVREAYDIVRYWGFKPSTLLVWCKRPNGIGLGGTYSLTTEFVLFCRKGSCKSRERVDTTWWEWRRGRHSEKPQDFYNMVRVVSPGPYLDMFSRRCIPDFDLWGDEAPNHRQEVLPLANVGGQI